MKHLNQLDGLRALAVFSVMAEHWLPQKFGIPFGSGVYLFFVLSGFLITRILLNCRDRVESSEVRPMRVFRQFYMRRFLRIFPLFYLVIFLATMLGLIPGEAAIWHYLYLSPFYFAKIGSWPVEGHFWSLAAEEHFYIFWPAFILLLKRNWLKYAMCMLIVLAPVFRLVSPCFDVHPIVARGFVVACFDSLVLGALVAYISYGKDGQLVWPKKAIRAMMICGLMTIIVGFVIRLSGGFAEIAAELQRFGMNLVFAWVIFRASIGFHHPVGMILSSSILTYLGKISYGLYVYHAFVPTLWARFGPESFYSVFSRSIWLEIALWVVTTVTISAISWHFFESKINSLKRHFPYVS